MPSIDDINIIPGSGNLTFGHAAASGTSTGTTIVSSGTTISATQNYVVPAQTNGTTFVSLTDGPGGILTNALLLGGTNKLTFTPVPTTANQVLVWSGTSFSWQVLPSFSGVLSVATPFAESTQNITVATLSNVTILSAKLIVKTAFGADTTISVGSSTNSTEILSSSNIIQTQLGVYSEELYLPLTTSTLIEIYVNVGNSAASGTGTLILEYITGTV